MNDDELRERIAGLPRSIEPPRDLWPAIEGRIAPSRWRRKALAIAAALALVIGSSAVTVLVIQSGDDAAGPQVADIPAPRFLEVDYVTQTRSLSELLDRQRDQLSPETVATLERNLAIIDAAIVDSRAALAGDPSNPELETLLRAGYEQKVALLERATRLVRES